jgi:methyl-accepting chemotaxis protein
VPGHQLPGGRTCRRPPRAPHIARNIAHVNHGATDTGSASGKVLACAQALGGEGNKLEVGRFFRTVQVA